MECSENLVLSAKDASLLISKRSSLPHKVCLSVKGCITAMSEIIRMKGDDMFLLEVDHCVFIIVKDYHLDWHAQLVPFKTVTLYELRLTTIEKGVCKPLPILVAWKTSSISKEPVHEERITCYTYKGKVTKIVDSHDGIFELNDSVRLVTWLNSSIQRDLYLHLGCNIQVYNAHKIKDASGQTNLICCSRSLIKSDGDPVIKLNIKTAEKSLRQQSCRCCLDDLKSTISKYRLNLKEVEELLHLTKCLKIGKSRKEMRYLLHYITKSFCHENIEENNYSVLDTFLQHEEFCPFNLSRSAECRIPTQLTTAWLQELEEEEEGEKMEEGNSSKWQYKNKEWKDDKMLLGNIVISRDGQTEFADQCGRMPVVLIHRWRDCNTSGGSSTSSVDTNSNDLPGQSNNHPGQSNNLPGQSCSHQCSCSCRNVLEPAENITCPFLSPSFIGKMFYTQRFHLVTEYFNNSNEDCESKDVITFRYLMLSLLDCVVLENVHSDALTDISNFNFDSRKIKNNQDYVLNNDHQTACFIYVSGKQQRQCSERLGTYFLLTGRMFDPDLLIGDDASNSDCKGKGSNLLKANEDSLITGDNVYNINEDDCNVLKRSIASVSDVSVDVIFKKKKSEELPLKHVIVKQKASLQDALSKSTPITLNFNMGNTKLFPLIQPGYFYFLKHGKNCAAFRTAFLNEQLGKAVKKCKAKVSIEVPDPVEVKNMFGNSSERLQETFDVNDKLFAVSVKQVLSEQFEGSLVSFPAIVLQRQTKCSFFSKGRKKAACSNFKDVQLDLCDLRSYQSGSCVDQIPLYFEAGQMLYVLGLIPGMVIDVCCVERKVSKINNVYCRFISVSSLHIRSFLPMNVTSFKTKLKTTSCDFTQHPKEYIATIWNHNPEDYSSLRRVWLIQCHICVIFSLKLQLSCQKCRGIFLNSCQSRGCDNATSFDVGANSVILVEDGTCQAKVNVRKSDLVRKLLTLSDKQWDDVISLLKNTGQIYIAKRDDTSSSNPLDIFFVDLIGSSFLIRPLKMLVRVSKDSHCKKTVMNMKEEEFYLKDLRCSQFTHKVLHLPFFSLDCVDLEEGF